MKLLNIIFVLILSTIKVLSQSLNADISVRDVSCFGAIDGRAEVKVNSGIPPYTYSWSNDLGNGPTANSCPPGNYSCDIRDGLGRSLIKSFQVKEPPKITVLIYPSLPKCRDRDGSILIKASGGIGDLSCTWDFDNTDGFLIKDIAAGPYQYLIKDGNGCSVYDSVLLSVRNAQEIASVFVKPASCAERSDGKAEVNLVGGQQPYTYFWKDNPTSNSKALESTAGVHILRVTDLNNCVTYHDVKITSPPQLKMNIQITDNKCKLKSGKVLTTVLGGTPPYSYSWSNSQSTNSFIINRKSELGFVTSTDSNGCSVSNQYRILDIGGPEATIYQQKPEYCFDVGKAELTVNVINGRQPFLYKWSPYGGDLSKASALGVGSYSVFVTDADGCISSSTYEIRSPNILDASIVRRLPSSPSMNDGRAMSIVQGGKYPYTYLWSTGATSESITGTTDAPLSLIVTDAYGCSTTAHQQSLMSSPYPGPSVQCSVFNTPNLCIDTSGSLLQTVTRSITDFGADGSDDVSDECAFEMASSFFQSLDSLTHKTLLFPRGTYIVGRQTPGYNFLLTGHNVLNFRGVNDLSLIGETGPQGEPTSIIKFAPCMYYGAFDTTTMERWISFSWDDPLPAGQPWKLNSNHFFRIATVGDIINMFYCTNILIKDLELDGNMDQTELGGGYTEGMQQGGYSGITLNATRHVRITNVRVHHFGYDGITIRDNFCPTNFGPSDYNATRLDQRIHKSFFYYNSRNNMSWDGGSDVTVTASGFSHAGQGRVTSIPACGLDIEYEPAYGYWGRGTTRGRFYDCEFSYNAAFAIADHINHAWVYDHKFYNCVFVGNECAYLDARGTKFDNCTFVGRVSSQHDEPISFQGQQNDNQTSFTGCSFNEEWNVPSLGRRSFQLTPEEFGLPCQRINHDYLLHSLGRRQTFVGCKSETNFSTKDAAFNIPANGVAPPWMSWNKAQIRGFGMRNHGLNGCDCDHELSAMYNCNFIGDGQGNILPMIGPMYAGIRNCPPHPTPFYSVMHYSQHHGNHGYVGTQCSYEYDLVGHTFGGFTTNYCYPCAPIWDSVPKYMHPIDPQRVNLFTGYPPYHYTTLQGLRAACLDPQRRAHSKESDNSLSIYPNPATSKLTVYNVPKTKVLNLVSPLGEVLMSEISIGFTVTFDISELQPGVYFITTDKTSTKFIKL